MHVSDSTACLYQVWPYLQMGAELGARAISHLEKISETGIQAMSRAGSIAVVLPTTAYILRLTPPPVRDMIDAGVAVALGSDFNPNAHCLAMVSEMQLVLRSVNLELVFSHRRSQDFCWGRPGRRHPAYTSRAHV